MAKNNIKPAFVSLCTPTFNRRPFIPYLIKCIQQQTYSAENMEWIIVDDGTDKIEDLVSHIPIVKYYKYDTKMTLGEKRNLMHTKATGDILVYIDDDDYYPPERVSHAVETLTNNRNVLICGSSKMHVYFKHIQQMYTCGPYGENHATAATFAFKRALLDDTTYDVSSCLGEEKTFLKNYSIPLAQLDPAKTILVFSHIHNSFDKKELLKEKNNFVVKSSVKVEDIVKDNDIRNFILHDIDKILEAYKPGEPSNKKDVEMYMNIVKNAREESNARLKKHHEDFQRQANVQFENLKQLHAKNTKELVDANKQLKETNQYLETKITKLIQDLVECKKEIRVLKEP